MQLLSFALLLPPLVGAWLSLVGYVSGTVFGWGFSAASDAVALVLAVITLQVVRVSVRSRGRVDRAPRWSRWVVLLALLALACVLALDLRAAPHGAGDAIAIWNLRAKFIASLWPDTSSVLADGQHHVDYPLLLPLAVGRLWSVTGTGVTAAWVPIVVALSFFTATCWLVFRTLWLAGASRVAPLAVVALCLGSFWSTSAKDQMADLPLSLWMLWSASLVIVPAKPSRSAMVSAGLLAGFAAWTKNEGLAFVAVLGLVLLVSPATRRRFWDYALGLAMPLAVLAHFKLVVVPRGNDLLTNTASLWSKLCDMDRYRLVLGRMAETMIEHALLPMLVLVLFACYERARREPSSSLESRASDGPPARAGIALILVAAQLSGYLMVYVGLSAGLAWHVDTSLERLVSHVWPLLVVAVALLCPVRAAKTTAAAHP